MTRYFLGTDGHVLVERRANPRYDVELDVEVTVVGGGAPLKGRTKDLSLAGMQLILPKAIRGGRVVDFSCPTFAGTAQAVWCHETDTEVHLGLRFVSLSPRDHEALVDVVTRLKRAVLAGAAAGWE